MTSITFVSLLIVAAVPAIRSQIPTLPPLSWDCNGLVANSIKGSMEGIDNCTFPVYKINASCVEKSCPELTSEPLCPVYKNGTYNAQNDKKVLRIINQCLKGTELCGILLNPEELPKLTFVADELFSGASFKGICYIENGTSTLDNINNTQLGLVNTTSIPPSAPLIFKSISEDVVYHGTFSCVLTSEFLDKILNSTNETLTFKLDDLPYSAEVNFQSVSIVNLTDPQDKPNVQSSGVVVSSELGQFNFSKEFPFLNAQNTVKDMLSNLLQSSDMDKAYGNFVSAIVNSAYDVAEKSCT
ncbi:hypothetical protein CHUAL_006500 [Chamberlinius hualienensis]